MRVNFDGMRKSATSDMNSLYNTIIDILDENKLDNELQDELIGKFNAAAYSVSIFNCLSDDTDENFNELDIKIDRIEELEKGLFDED